jgi:hypothetical protein
MVVKASVSFLTNDSDAVLNTDVSNIVTSLTDNINYPSPNPTLPIMTTANIAFATAIADAADGGKQHTSAKRARRAELLSLMRKLAIYVQGACDGDMTKLLSSGFPVQKPDRTPATVPATPDAPKVSQGRTGEAFAASSPVDGAYIYNWRVALASAPDTVVQHLQSTGARATFEGLTPGQTYRFQCNAVGTAGTSDWSNAGTLMVI